MIDGSMSLARRLRIGVIAAVLAVFGLSLAWTYLAPTNEGPSYPYSSLLADASTGKVEAITQEGLRLSVTLTGGEVKAVSVASDAINVYAEVCAAAGKQPGPACPIRFSVVRESAAGQWLGLLVTSLLPVFLIGSFIYFMMRVQQKK